MTANTDSEADTQKTVTALDAHRPPAETIVGSYEIVGDEYERVELDEPVPESEIPADAHRGDHIKSISDLNAEEDGFVIVHRRVVEADDNSYKLGTELDTDESGIIRCLAPDYDIGGDQWWEGVKTFDTWQEAEAFVAENFDQPDGENEIITPIPANSFTFDVDVFLLDKSLTDDSFHTNDPTDEAFTADAIPIDVDTDS